MASKALKYHGFAPPPPLKKFTREAWGEKKTMEMRASARLHVPDCIPHFAADVPTGARYH